MIVKEIKEPSRGCRNRTKRSLLIKCDECEKEFIRKYSIDTKNKLHFCSRRCMGESKRKDGAMHDKLKAACMKKHGVEYLFQSQKIKEKCKNTNLKKYGVEHAIQAQKIKDRRKAENFKKYGVEYASQTRQAIEKRKKTNLEKYGTEQTLSVKSIRKKAEKTNIEKYGNKNPTASKIIREKIDQTNLQRYGVKNAFNQESVKKNANSKKARIKRHQTMKKNNTYGKSRAEDRFYEYLCVLFKKENVERQVRINSWNIDFEVKGTFIQFDGTYWHGQNRPLQEIISSKNPRDKVIYETCLRDKEQNSWFKENNLKLIRVTDKELEQQKEKVYDKLKEI